MGSALWGGSASAGIRITIFEMAAVTATKGFVLQNGQTVSKRRSNWLYLKGETPPKAMECVVCL